MPESLHLVEDRLTLADIAVASPLVNLGHLGIHVDSSRHPRLHAFADAMLSRESFGAWIEREAAFLKATAN